MAKWAIEKCQMVVGGQKLAVRALSARERQDISAAGGSGVEMEHRAVLACTEDREGNPAFKDLAEVLDSPCGYVNELANKILELSGIAVGGKANPT